MVALAVKYNLVILVVGGRRSERGGGKEMEKARTRKKKRGEGTPGYFGGWMRNREERIEEGG